MRKRGVRRLLNAPSAPFRRSSRKSSRSISARWRARHPSRQLGFISKRRSRPGFSSCGRATHCRRSEQVGRARPVIPRPRSLRRSGSVSSSWRRRIVSCANNSRLFTANSPSGKPEAVAADDNSYPCQLHPLAQQQADYVAPLRAQRQADTDLMPALGNRVGHHAVDADHR